MEKNIILEVKNLSVRLDNEDILKNISFNVGAGEAVAIIGPNGAGKTVLFKTLLELIPYEGEIKWKKNIKIGYVPQRFTIDKNTPITVKEFFLLKTGEFWLTSENFLKHFAHELKLVGLDESILKKRMADLSGGQIQRLLVSWSLLDHPEIILFDEPTSGIDIGFEETIYNLMHRLQDERGLAILLISHDLNVIYRHANVVLCLNKEMICRGAPRKVLTPRELEKLYGETSFYHHLENELK